MEFSGSYMKSGGVTSCLANDICVCVLLCCELLSFNLSYGEYRQKKEISLGFSIIFECKDVSVPTSLRFLC